MQIKLSCADFTFHDLAHDAALDQIAELGFSGVDVGLFPEHSHFQPRDYLDNPTQAARTLTRRVLDRGLELADLFLQPGRDLTDLAENHPDPGERRRSREIFQRTVELAARCQASHLTGLPGMRWPDESAVDSLTRAAEELAWRVEQAAAAQVVYAVEPHLWSIAATPTAALRLVELVPGLTLTLDYGHFVCQDFTADQIEPLAAHASHVHARAACPGLLQADWAQNTVDFAAMLAALCRADYAGWIALEYVSVAGVRELPAVDNVRETTRLRDLLVRSLAAPRPKLQKH